MICMFFLALMVAVCQCAPQQGGFSGQFQQAAAPTTTPVPIIKHINQMNEDGSYTFGYEGGDGSFRVEIMGKDGVVRGKYGYKDADGTLRVVEYLAGNTTGFEPKGDHIKVPPRPPPKQPGEVDYDDYDEEAARRARVRPAQRPRGEAGIQVVDELIGQFQGNQQQRFPARQDSEQARLLAQQQLARQQQQAIALRQQQEAAQRQQQQEAAIRQQALRQQQQILAAQQDEEDQRISITPDQIRFLGQLQQEQQQQQALRQQQFLAAQRQSAALPPFSGGAGFQEQQRPRVQVDQSQVEQFLRQLQGQVQPVQG